MRHGYATQEGFTTPFLEESLGFYGIFDRPCLLVRLVGHPQVDLEEGCQQLNWMPEDFRRGIQFFGWKYAYIEKDGDELVLMWVAYGSAEEKVCQLLRGVRDFLNKVQLSGIDVLVRRETK